GSRQAAAVSAEGGRIVLLAHRPEAAGAGERQLRARHLADRAATLAKQCQHGSGYARAPRPLVHLRVRVQQAVGEIADDLHSRTSTILPTWRRSSMEA